MNIDPGSLGDWLKDGKLALDLLRSAVGLLPKKVHGEATKVEVETAELEAVLAKAEDALKRSEASAAQALGYLLCKCTFPPQIMLWREQEGAFVCDRCEHRSGKAYRPDRPSLIDVRRTGRAPRR